MQRSERLFRGELPICFVSAVARFFGQDLDDGVDFRINGLNPCEMRLDDLAARCLFPDDESREFARRTAPQLGRELSP
jgi:hypothetical protein